MLISKIYINIFYFAVISTAAHKQRRACINRKFKILNHNFIPIHFIIKQSLVYVIVNVLKSLNKSVNKGSLIYIY